MIIRIATLEDVEEVSLLWKDMVNELLPELTPNVLWWQEMCRKLLAIDIYYIYVAEDQDRLVGFIDFLIFPEPSTGKIHGTGQHYFVTPEYRGTLIGGRLFKTAEHFAVKEKGVDVVELFCSPEDEHRWTKKHFEPKRLLMRKSHV